jgi:adenylate kinase
MRIVLMGAPGAGKGTQARKMVATFGIPQIASGDLLRAAVAAGTELGRKVKSAMDAGSRVPNALVVDLIRHRLREPDTRQGFILAGFPRNTVQAEALEDLLGAIEARQDHLDHAIQIDVPFAELKQRLSGRLFCSGCGAVFNTRSAPPRTEGICDLCGENLVRRDEDNEGTVDKRLKSHEEETAALLDYYHQRHLLRHVNGTRDIELVFDEIRELLA